MNVVKADWTDKKVWAKATFDCDDFARVFFAHMTGFYGLTAVGLIWNPQHAWNIIFLPQGHLMFEPQTDEWVVAEGKYALDEAIVVV